VATEEHDTEVYTIVFYGPGIASAPHTLRRGSAIFPDGNMENRICHSLYTMQQVFLGQWDGEAVLQELRDGVASGAALSEKLLTPIKLAPLMRHQRPLEEVVREVAELTNGPPKAVHEETIGTMLGLRYNYLDRALIDQLLKEPSVANA